MTLDEAIKHAEEIVKEEQYEYQECVATHNTEGAMNCRKYAEEHRQLAEWLKELKRVREQEPILDKIKSEIEQLTSRYSISKERGGMGQVEWSDRLIKESDVLQIIDKYRGEQCQR